MEELETMRAQMALLKEKLDQQTIVSDQLLRQITSERVQHLHRYVWIEGLAALFVITFGNMIFHNLGCSVAFLIGTTILMVGCFLATLLPHRWIRQTDILQGNLLTVAQQVKRLRRLYDRWLYIAIPIVLLWAGWLAWELYLVNQDNLKYFIAIIIAAVIGGVIGGLIGNHLRKQSIREMDTIMNDIEQ